MIFHITTPDAWSAARASGSYWTGDEDFIHFSYESQVAATAERYYAGEDGLIVLVVDDAGLDVRVEGGFPHLYEPLPAASVVEVRPLGSLL